MGNYSKQLHELVTEALRPLDDGDTRWVPVGWAKTQAERTWEELDYNRRESRRLFLCNEYAIGGTNCRVNYICGQGFKYEFVAKNPGVPVLPEALAELNQWLAEVDEVNDVANFEAEAAMRYDRDGEFFIRLFSGDVPQFRFVEPERVHGPDETNDEYRDHLGLRTDRDDWQTVLGYWIKPTVASDEPELVEEAYVVHVKANVDSSCLRGSPTYTPVFENLRRCEDLLASMSSMAKARAKIALVMQIENFNKQKAEDVVTKLTQSSQAHADGTRTQVTIEKLPIGSILRVPDTTQVTFPNSSVGASDYIDVLQADLRAVAQPLNMPEWMFTGLADQKYSNAFVVEAPTLRAFSRIQKTLTTAFGTGRVDRRASLVWRAVMLAVEAGRLQQDLLDLVKLNCTAPALEVRDKQAESAVNIQYITAGVKSVVGVQRELGLDPEQVAKEIEDAKPKDQPAGGSPIQEALSKYQGRWYTESALQWVIEKRDLSSLVKTVITNKNGKKQTVYRKPVAPAPAPAPAKPATPKPNPPETPDSSPKPNPNPNPPETTKRQADQKEAYDSVQKLIAEEKPTPETVAASVDSLRKLTIVQLKQVKDSIGLRGGKVKEDHVQALFNHFNNKLPTAPVSNNVAQTKPTVNAKAKPPVDTKVAMTPGWDRGTLEKNSTKLFKTVPSDQQFAAIGNAVNGAAVNLIGWQNGSISIDTKGKGIKATRTIKKKADGSLVCENEVFQNDSKKSGQRGSDLLLEQVNTLRSLGVSKIETFAGGKKNSFLGLNGYYTWPRLGYDGAIPKDLLEKLPTNLAQQMGKSKNLLKLFSTDEGAKWWKENGDGIKCTFDTAENSPNMQALTRYLANRKDKPRG